MTQTIVFDTELSCEMPVVHAIILLQDTSQMHARDEQEHARLQAAFDEMRTANRAKTDFLSRMSHDIRSAVFPSPRRCAVHDPSQSYRWCRP